MDCDEIVAFLFEDLAKARAAIRPLSACGASWFWEPREGSGGRSAFERLRRFLVLGASRRLERPFGLCR
jgi:hypothetical protein